MSLLSWGAQNWTQSSRKDLLSPVHFLLFLQESVLAGCLHDPLPQQVSQPHQHCKDLLGYLQELNPSSIKEINPANARNKLFSTKSTSRDKFLSVREKV
ncbi:uncharacterized protein [Struthio camelus]|uniref:uncharacterized protein isoform X11 n=1 Tax=Struthio camelus TaxID=8801 RepID=UPI003603BBBD